MLEPDAHGLTILPFVAGERSPGWAERARAAIVGANLNTSPHEIVRAALEAVAYRFALVDRLLEHAVPVQRDTVASGGALTVSPSWLQILADVLGRPITVSAEEATARGTALLALQALGALRSLEVTHATGRTYQPNAARHARYQEAIERQSRLYAQLIDRDADDERRQE
jgi:gluconokinase